MRTSVVAPREVFDAVLPPSLRKNTRLSESKTRPSPPLVLPLLLCAPLALTLWTISAELSLVATDLTTVSQVQCILDAAEEVSPVLETVEESQLFNATFYPEAVFKTDWSEHISSSDILHESALHRGCVKHKKSIIPWTFGRIGQSESDELNELVNRSDPNLLEKLRKCPDVDILLPDHLRSYGYCEDAAAYTKFLESRMLPKWALEVKFNDVEHKRSVSYHDLCPNTPMIFFNHYWEGVPDAPEWPATKPFYLMPNIEMYELESVHYWRADVVLCKTALCARNLRKWFQQEGNPRGTRVVYTRHTTTNLALTTNSLLSASQAAELAAKNFSDVSFLHTAGKSIQKGTRQVLDCWLSQPDFPPLDFYMDQELYDGGFSDYEERIKNSGNVRLHTGGLSAEAFGRVIAQGRYFLCPSMMEGYGHYINQARSSNAFIITTDAAPMNELITHSSGALVRARTGAYGEQFMGGVSTKEHALRNVSGLVANFERDDVCNTVTDILKSSTAEEREQSANRALQQYYFDTVFFAHKMKELRTFSRAMSHPSLRGKILDGARRF
ncbi:Glycosyl transferase, family 1 [Phytophthora cinnamomi]|uniref:Glycosyl transferase, family 1 n=1 Tax=Phytophthora cinnamomi TaxID=4785 RepID=UPI00355A78D5|nr:Glycosyl transferase, family 1 [Phytophthora cinnamomi]